jgi:chaperonin GroES
VASLPGPSFFVAGSGDVQRRRPFSPSRTREAEPMSDSKKRLIVVGDRVLIQPEEGEDRTKVGLYLPPTAVDSQAVQGGTVMATGPGNAVSAPTELSDEPWKIGAPEPRYLPLQARLGDYAIFFRKAAVEITFEGDRYLVVPQAAILTLVREEDEESEDLLPPF